MNRSLWRVSVRHLLRRRWQSILFIVGVALGVAMMVAIDLANGSASRAFELATDSVAGKATHQIVGGPSGLDATLYRHLRVDLGMRNSAPVVEGYVTAAELGSQPLNLLGVDPFAEAPFRDYLAGAAQGSSVQELTELLTRPESILIAESLAQRYHLAPGSLIHLQVGARERDVTLAGVIRPGDDVSRRALEGLIVTDIASAQEILGMTGRLSHIDLLLPDAASPAGRAQLTQIQALLPPGATIEQPAARANAVQQMSAAFELNLTALSLLALVVGIFLIYNTVSFSVIQRRADLGTLRALGVSRGEVFAIVLGEAAVLGLIGTLAGLGLGILLGRVAVGMVTQTITDLYFVVSVRSVDVPPATLLKGVVIGLGAALLAAAVPAYEATSVPPAGAMRRSTIESKVRSWLPWLTLGGLVVGAAGTLLIWLPDVPLAFSFAGLFALVLAFALLAPGVTALLMRLLAYPAGRMLGMLGRMAPRTVARSLSRTSVAIAALMVAVSVIIGVSLMISSFRYTVEDWLSATLQADIFISAPGFTATRVTAALPPGLAQELARQPGIRRVDTARSVTATSPDLGPVSLVAVSGDISDGKRRYLWMEGRTSQELWQAIGRGGVVVSEPFVNINRLPNQGRGYTLQLRSDRGLLSFPIVGVYYDYTAGAGTVLMDDAVYRRAWDDSEVSSIVLFVMPGQNVDGMVQRLQDRFAGRDELSIRSNAGLRRAVLTIFDRAFAITVALQLLATVVAFIGVLSALLSLQLERTRELGILRANGLSRRQVWGLALLETGLMGTTAGLLALPAGLVLALVLVDVINVRSFGWTLLLQIDPLAFVQAFVVALLAALLAGVYPAWRQASMLTAEALRAE